MRQTVLADQLSDAVKGVLVLGGVVVVPLLLVGIGVLGWHLERKRARRYEADTRPGALRHNCFDGRYCVDVSPVQWQLDIATVRTIAAERGYVETRPRFAGAMSFVLSGEAGRRMPPGPARYEPEFAGAAALSSRESSLVATIRANGELWISLRQYELSRARLEMLVGMHGMQVVCACVDDTDQLLLVRASGSGRNGSAEPARKHIRPTFVIIIASIVTALSIPVMGVLLALLGYPAVAYSLVIVACFSLLLPCSLRLVSRSRRARLLHREFNGRACVSIFLRWYGFSDYMVSEMAAYCGYWYGQKKYHRNQGPYINYVRAV